MATCKMANNKYGMLLDSHIFIISLINISEGIKSVLWHQGNNSPFDTPYFCRQKG